MTNLLLKEDAFNLLEQILDKMVTYEEMIPFVFLHSLTALCKAIYSSLPFEQREEVIKKIQKGRIFVI